MKGPQSEFGWGLIQQQNLPRLYYQAHMPMCASRKKADNVSANQAGHPSGLQERLA